jgi:hypothetical protein
MAGRPGAYRGEKRRREDTRKARKAAKVKRKEERVAGAESESEEDLGQSRPEYVWHSLSRNRTVTTTTAARPATDLPDDWVLLAAPEPPKGEERSAQEQNKTGDGGR